MFPILKSEAATKGVASLLGNLRDCQGVLFDITAYVS